MRSSPRIEGGAIDPGGPAGAGGLAGAGGPAADLVAGGGARGALGWLMAALAVAGLAIALYLTWTKVQGELPVCGPVKGCETVATSEYSAVAGIPTALFGAGASALTLAGALLWWRRADRRGLYLAYALGLASLPFLAWLTYLEVAVINAICVWCVSYAVIVVGGLVVATLALVRGPGRSSHGAPSS